MRGLRQIEHIAGRLERDRGQLALEFRHLLVSHDLMPSEAAHLRVAGTEAEEGGPKEAGVDEPHLCEDVHRACGHRCAGEREATRDRLTEPVNVLALHSPVRLEAVRLVHDEGVKVRLADQPATERVTVD